MFFLQTFFLRLFELSHIDVIYAHTICSLVFLVSTNEEFILFTIRLNSSMTDSNELVSPKYAKLPGDLLDYC